MRRGRGWAGEARLGPEGWGTKPTKHWGETCSGLSGWLWGAEQTHLSVRLRLFTGQIHLPSRSQHPQPKSQLWPSRSMDTGALSLVGQDCPWWLLRGGQWWPALQAWLPAQGSAPQSLSGTWQEEKCPRAPTAPRDPHGHEDRKHFLSTRATGHSHHRADPHRQGRHPPSKGHRTTWPHPHPDSSPLLSSAHAGFRRSPRGPGHHAVPSQEDTPHLFLPSPPPRCPRFCPPLLPPQDSQRGHTWPVRSSPPPHGRPCGGLSLYLRAGPCPSSRHVTRGPRRTSPLLRPLPLPGAPSLGHPGRPQILPPTPAP